MEALKLLQETYLARVKAIYIDPPYNTGKDFIYKDKFTIGKTIYEEKTGARDKEGRLVANLDSGGRYHSNWLSMIYPRLKLARNLLSQDGVIFISIDDNEQHNLRKLMDEIFGSINFIAQFVWHHRKSSQNDIDVSLSHNYILCYSRERSTCFLNPLRTDESKFSNPDNDPRGLWVADPMDAPEPSKNLNYPITNPNTGKTYFPPANRHWRFSLQKFEKALAENRIVFGKTGKSKPQYKRFLSEALDRGTPVNTIWSDVGTATNATQELMRMFDGKKVFSTPKPVRLIEHLLRLSTSAGKVPDAKSDDSGGRGRPVASRGSPAGEVGSSGSLAEGDIVMDFFAGSGTTAHAVMKLNQEDGGQRRFIMVQWPEECGEKTEAFKAGYETIADIGKERIRRAAKTLADTSGFRVLKIGDSNFKDCSLPPDEYKLEDLENMADNLLPNRKPLDLLFEAMLILGLDLHSPIQTQTIQNKQVFFVADNQAIACFEEGLTEEFAKALVNYKPRRVVFLDGGFASDAVRINIEQLFQQLSPTTHITIL